jgi:hypothetical protein|mmetsp:Transcript_31737/g.42035  ORF Transcript_31737/g.42035 Transcript_31737/m.42035 type:complete len:271 (+) Transcript_31737:1805-2617(+)
MTAEMGLWYDGELASWNTWELLHTGFQGAQNTTTFNETTGENVTDYSNNTSKYFYEKIYENDMLRLRDAWEVKDAWQVEQTIEFDNYKEVHWVTNEFIYTGEYFAQRFGYNGENILNYNMTVDTDADNFYTSAEKVFNTTDGPVTLNQYVNMADGSIWTDARPAGCEDDECALFSGYFDLTSGYACNKWIGHEQDCFSLEGSGYAPTTDENRSTRVWLLGKNSQDSSSAGFDAKTTVGVAAALLTTLALGVYTSKRVRANRTDSDEFIRA